MRSLAKFHLPQTAYQLQRLLSQLVPRPDVPAVTQKLPHTAGTEKPSKTSHKTQDVSPHDQAETATLKAFLNGYMREIVGGHVTAHANGRPRVVEFDLPQSLARLKVDIIYWSLTGPHDFGPMFLYNAQDRRWRTAQSGEVIPMLVRDCFARSDTDDGQKQHELLRRILNSYDQIAKCCPRAGTPPPEFLAAEQSLIFGHWLHPTPKSREGMTDWQAAAYAPELNGTFQLRYFAVDRNIAYSGAVGHRATHDLIKDIPGLDEAGFCIQPHELLLPMHPLQAEALCLQPAVRDLLATGKLRDLGAAGTRFSATSSVRTVYAPDCRWMFKFSLPVKITNSQRINLLHELEAGGVMAQLLAKTGFLDRHPQFGVINDPGFVSVTLPGQRESGFEVIIRENPFSSAAQPVVTIAALTADAPAGDISMLARLVMDVAARQSLSEAEAATRWFDAYLDCALHPALALYDTYGIALEAHQQNSLLDVHQGVPTRYYFRDNQGYYISDKSVDRLAQLEPRVTTLKSICFPEDEITDRFGYYLIVNQVFSIISRLGRDGFLAEHLLLDRLRAALRRAAGTCRGPAARFAHHVLTSPRLASKANLLTRIHDVDELRAEGEKAIYIRLENPILQQETAQVSGQRNVPA